METNTLNAIGQTFYSVQSPLSIRVEEQKSFIRKFYPELSNQIDEEGVCLEELDKDLIYLVENEFPRGVILEARNGEVKVVLDDDFAVVKIDADYLIGEITYYGETIIFDSEEGDLRLYKSLDELKKEVKDYWHDMAQFDPETLRELVGTETLVSWALNRPAGPGSIQAHSFNEWVEDCIDEDLEEFMPWEKLHEASVIRHTSPELSDVEDVFLVEE